MNVLLARAAWACALALAMTPAAPPTAGAAPVAAPPAAAASAPAAPCAVVELFTSEGCSSCPPAEALLTRLDAEARAAGRPVYLLEFHVDYWDGLGWRDPYSSAAASARQRDYAARLGLDQVYTPQMVVDGRTGFVGSNAARAEREIAAALNRPAAARVELAVDAATGRARVRVSPAPRAATILLARVDSPPAARVARGENAGRMLRHSDVVRAFAGAPLDAQGEAVLEAPRLGRRPAGADGRWIAVAQDRATGAVLGAAALPIGPPTAR